MNDSDGYAVFFFPQALEALGSPIQPYLQGEGEGAHVVCSEIDTGGALIEMTLQGKTADGVAVELELMVPTSMVRMIVSARTDDIGDFGFGPRLPAPPPVAAAPAETSLPPAGPGASPAAAPPSAVPGTDAGAGADEPVSTPGKP